MYNRAGHFEGVDEKLKPSNNKERTATLFGLFIETFDANWIESHESSSTAAPVFICGTFRSGSTLLEQILASHSSITAVWMFAGDSLLKSYI